MKYRKKIYGQYLTARESAINFSDNNFASSLIWYKKEVLPRMPKDKSVQILELGCGTGAFLKLLSDSGYNNITGVEIGSEQLLMAEKLGVKKYVVQDDILNFLRKKEKKYNIIFAFDVLEHFTKDEVIELLSLIYDNLGDLGMFIFRTPNGEALFSGRYRYGDFTHELCFTRNSLNQVLKLVGFKEVKCYPCKPVVHGFKSFIRRVIYEIYEKFFIAYLVAETGELKGYILTQNLWGIARK